MKKLRILGGFDFFLIFHIFYIFLRMKTSRPLGGGRALKFFCDFLGRAMKKLGISE